MKKSVTYSVVLKKDPRNPETSAKYYAQAQARGVMGIREMAERIQQGCTVARADTMAVLVALENTVAEGLQGGEIVRLGDLGTLRISLSGEGTAEADKYNNSMIRKARILFHPGATLKQAINNLSFERVSVKSVSTSEETDPESEA